MDLDQSGTYRQWVLRDLGPSVGWTATPDQNLLPINSAGSFVIDRNTNVVEVAVVGAVTIVLPSTLNSPAGALAVPGSYLNTPITVIDVGGNAAAHPITIQAAAGDTINGVGSLQITQNYGDVLLVPNPAQRLWISSN
jgi:hypothetical protein